eukprot:3024741-Rhodomonas_salina.1
MARPSSTGHVPAVGTRSRLGAQVTSRCGSGRGVRIGTRGSHVTVRIGTQKGHVMVRIGTQKGHVMVRIGTKRGERSRGEGVVTFAVGCAVRVVEGLEVRGLLRCDAHRVSQCV